MLTMLPTPERLQVDDDAPIPITWPDGQQVQVYPVRKAGLPHIFLRAVRAAREGGSIVVFDVRDVFPALEADMLSAPARDHQGLLLYTARLQCQGASDFVARALRHEYGQGEQKPRAEPCRG